MNKLAAIIAGATLITGCTISQSQRVASSHFVYPNSNVSPTKPSKGSTTKLCGILVFSWNGHTSEAQEAAYKEAIDSSGSDLVINANMTTSMFMFPGLFTTCSTAVEGMGAKMTVGKQELR